MAVEVKCPACRAILAVPEAALGKKLRCKKCGDVFRSEPPAAAEPRDDEDEPKSRKRAEPDEDDDRPARRSARSRDDDEDDEDDRPARRSKKQRKKSNPVLYIVGLLVAVAVAVTAIVVVVNMARDREEAAKNQAGGTTRGGDQPGEKGTSIGAPAPMAEQLVTVSAPVFSRAGGGPTVSVDYEIFGDRTLPPRLILVIRYMDGFTTQDLDLNGLRPGERRRVTIELEKNVQVKFGQIELWVGIPGGSALVGTSQRVSNVERVAAP
jgi:predicted Zn finger-like uncharacterized protein